jgi:Domain of unknown function (DUF4192)
MTDSRHDRQPAQRCRVKVGSADGVLAVVPHLLGFHPAHSLVMLGASGPHARIRLAFRYDLPDPPDRRLAGDIAAHVTAVLARQHLTTVIAIGYGPGRTVTPVIDVVTPALQACGAEIRDVLRVEDSRYWSYLCGEPACCPPEGVHFDAAGHPAATALAAAGLTVRTDRAALAATLAPDPEAARLVGPAADRALQRAAGLIDRELAIPGTSDLLRPITEAGRRAVRSAISTYRRGGAMTDQDEIAWLGLMLTDLRIRDDAWARMDPQHSDAHQRLWTDLVRRLPGEHVPAPASLLAFTAWQAGDGALASIALERALGADPAYSMAILIGEAVQAGLPPSAARLPMTPKQVAAAYAKRRPRPARRSVQSPP